MSHVPPAAHDEFPKPPWSQAAIWTGADLRTVLKNFSAHRWRVDFWFDCLADLAFGGVNSTLWAVQQATHGWRERRVELRRDPLFIVGHWRTGTTLLHELLALDERHAFPTTFQCFLPNHFLISRWFLKSWTGFALPMNRPPDQMKMGWDRPQEDEFALCNLGVPSPYASIGFPNEPPVYQQYYELDDLSEAERARWIRGLRTFLRRVQWTNRGRLILKSPTHTFRIPTLLKIFPDARFVYLVRRPEEVFLSTVRLWKSLYVAHGYQRPTFEGLEDRVLATFARMHQRVVQTRSNVPERRWLELRYEDLVDDIPAAVQRVYEQLELDDYSPVADQVQQYVQEHADYQAGSYDPPAELTARLRAKLADYYEAYGYC